jgi:FtsP/CotA-like multicopper oxidase with cupredoxin domain
VSDWVQKSAFDEFQFEKNGLASIAATDSIVVNGKGIAPYHNLKATVDNISNITLTPGKKHRLRLINSSAGTAYIFSIDGHNLTVIASDFVSIQPYTTPSLLIAIGKSLHLRRCIQVYD